MKIKSIIVEDIQVAADFLRKFCEKSGKVEEAIKLYRDAIAQRPNFAEALLNLGHALKAKGHQDEAKTCWKQALEVKPELAQGYFEQAAN